MDLNRSERLLCTLEIERGSEPYILEKHPYQWVSHNLEIADDELEKHRNLLVIQTDLHVD